ncbi:MAG TPA: polysaccharide deacetylase family protein [Flavisolibacter sp.]|nr:polysaccharide deacetylase family protein [Flavisolibacter sp.]
MSHSALIFSHSITPRLKYVVDFLSDYYGLKFKLVSSEEIYLQAADACKINYSYHRLAEGEIFIHSHVLLFESSVRPVKVECFEKKPFAKEGRPYKAFFRAEGDTGFDLLAAIFYLITRYEEYLPYKKDSYGRYAHENSIAFREGFLHLPLVNIWLEDLRVLLAERNAEFARTKARYAFVPTYDIDMAWSARNKGFKRNAGALIRLLLKARFRQFSHRLGVLKGKRKDPYDAYEWMDELHARHGLRPIYFFLLAKDRNRYDKNIPVGNPAFRQLIQDTASRYTTGLHPSWASNDLPSLLTKEKFSLEQVSGQTVKSSRQHFIRFHFPVTYQRLLALGITNEYSMGYGSINGFRASITTPYYWYDLKSEAVTPLLIHPFCFMDANAYYEQKMGSEEALHELLQLLATVRAVNGTMVTVWHNSFLGTDKAFEGWRTAYESFVAKALVTSP